MPEPKKVTRPWRVVAEEASLETDTRRLIELSSELQEALDRQIPNLLVEDSGTTSPPPFRHGDHICLSYHSEQYLLGFLEQYVMEGLRRDELCFCVQRPRILRRLVENLQSMGVDTDAEQGRGALELHTEREVYFSTGAFDPAIMINLLMRSLDECMRKGFSAFRTAGDLSWAMRDPKIYQTLIGYEQMVNQCYPGKPAIGLCQYQANETPVDFLKSILEHHKLHFSEKAASLID
jgi:hypothetical protein